MKRLVLLVILLVGLLSIPIDAQSTLNVGIDQSTRESWTAVAAEFQDETGMRVSFRPYPQVDFAQQIVIQQYLRTEKLHLVMIHEGWGPLVQSYLVDLKDYESRFRRDALSMAYLGEKLVGVWIPFAPDWFLAVLSWPEDRDATVTFLEVAAKATEGSEEATAAVSPQGVAANYRTTKINRADHNPKIDGSLAVLIGAAEDALGTLAAEMTARLPQPARSALEGLAGLYGVPFSSATSTVTVVGVVGVEMAVVSTDVRWRSRRRRGASASRIACSPSPQTSTSNRAASSAIACEARDHSPRNRSCRADACINVTCGPPRMSRASGLASRICAAIAAAAGIWGIVAVMP